MDNVTVNISLEDYKRYMAEPERLTVRQVRKSIGMTQASFAQTVVGIGRATYVIKESHPEKFRLQELWDISQYCQVSCYALVLGSIDQMNPLRSFEVSTPEDEK